MKWTLRGLLLALTLILAAPTAARAAGELYTLAGTSNPGTVNDGELAATADLGPDASIAPLGDGELLVGDGDRVWRIDPLGVMHAVAGAGGPAPPGDGGPAVDAALSSIDGIAALPGGGFLIADGGHGRVRMVDPGGIITTVAGGGEDSATDGIPATQAALGQPIAVAALPGGGFIEGQADGRVRSVGPDGLIRTIAGNGQTASGSAPQPGTPATSNALSVSGVAAAGDGSVFIADAFHERVYRVTPAGTLVIAAQRAGRGFSPTGVAALPDGGILVADNGGVDGDGAEARIWQVTPTGTFTPIAGSGNFVSNDAGGFETPGEDALDSDLGFVRAVAVASDGGALFAEGTKGVGADIGAVVHYVTPPAPTLLAVALLRDRDRVLTPGRANHVTIAATQSAVLTATVAGRRTQLDIAAGTTRVKLPASLPATKPQLVSITATDAGGRRAADNALLYPPRWLPSSFARYVAQSIAPATLGRRSVTGNGVLHCHRFTGTRIDCLMSAAGRRCDVVAAISFAGSRLRWGTYACGLRAHPRYRRAPRPLASRDWHCSSDDANCPPDFFGRLDEADLIPSDDG